MNMLRGIVVASLFFVIVGCGGGSKPKDLIVGKWKATEKKGGIEMTIDTEFTKDGTLKMSVAGMTINGKYKFIDDNNFEMSVGEKSQKVKIESITKEKMVTSDQDGKTEFTRVQ
jgi:hypothetical protein